MSGTAQIFPIVGSNVTIPNPLPTNVTEWDSTLLTGAPTNFGTAPSGLVIGGNVSIFAGSSALVLDGSGNLRVSISAGSVSINGGSVNAIISNPVTVVQPLGSSLHVDVDNFPVTQSVSGIITANQGTSPWVVSLVGAANVSAIVSGSVGIAGSVIATVSGNVTVNQGTSPWASKDAADMSGTVPGTAPSSTAIVGEI